MPDTVREMMSAYVLGCLDFRNLQQFIDILNKSDYIPYDELGEIQNVISLLPILLERTTPPASLQNDIFSQIPDEETPIETKEEKPRKKLNFSKIIDEEENEKNEKITDDEIIIPENISFTSLNDTDVEEKIAEKIEDEIFATKKNPKRTEKKSLNIQETEDEKNPYPHVIIKENIDNPIEKRKSIAIPPENFSSQPVNETTEEKAETGVNKNSKLWRYTAFVSIALLLIFIILYFTTKSNFTEKINSLKSEMEKQKITVEEKDNFINRNLPLITIFNNKDLVFVELTSINSGGKTDARLILSPTTKRGVLQFINFPKITKNNSLQLWLVNKGQSYSLGVFNPETNTKFYTLGKIPEIKFEEIELFRITLETKGGSEFPQGKTIYFGSFKFK